MQAILSDALTLTATPKGVIQKWATEFTLIYVKAPRLKNNGIAYLRVFSEYGMTNASISLGFTPDSNPKIGKKGVTQLLFIYVKEQGLKSLTWHTLGLSEYGLTN